MTAEHGPICDGAAGALTFAELDPATDAGARTLAEPDPAELLRAAGAGRLGGNFDAASRAARADRDPALPRLSSRVLPGGGRPRSANDRDAVDARVRRRRVGREHSCM